MKIIICISIISLSLSFGKCFSQASFEGNNLIGAPPNPFIGWDASVLNDALQIRHDAFQPILFSTFGAERMRIAEWGNVSIGGNLVPTAKLDVTLTNGNAAAAPNFESTAVFAYNRFQSEEDIINRGVRAISTSPNFGDDDYNGVNMAGSFWARRAFTNIGIFANASWFENLDEFEGPIAGFQGWGVQGVARDHETLNVAVAGRAASHSTFPNAFTVGVLGTAGPNDGQSNDWAGWFEGDVFISGQLNPGSDEMFKQNIEDIGSAIELIEQIQPRSYVFKKSEYPDMNFPPGTQYGVVAQEIEEVLPELVKQAFKPALVDSMGNEITEPLEFKTVNYNGLIPILIAAMQEQQSIIDAQNEALSNVMDQLDDLQQQISNCCTGGDSGFKNYSPGELGDESRQKASPNGHVLGQNSPNPFRSQTTISYTLEQGGKVLLNVYDKNGKVVANLMEGEQQAGNFRYEWDASGLPAGLYHYALYVDGELLVKKAIKLKD